MTEKILSHGNFPHSPCHTRGLIENQKTRGRPTRAFVSDALGNDNTSLLTIRHHDIEFIRLILRTLLYEEAIKATTKHES